MTRLSRAALADLPADIARPLYDLDAVRIGVVHLGIGAFHRAHQAVVFDDALTDGDLRWGVLGVSLRSAAVRDQLTPQDGLYTVVISDGERTRRRVIGAARGVLVGPENPDAVVEAMAAPEVHIVTLTVTEKGYRLDPASGKLAWGNPEVMADLADLSAPRTAPGYLIAALRRRRQRGLPPFTVLSCDNIPHNGQRLRTAVLAMAGRIDIDLAAWIAAEGAFPQTMVDRIVPATTAADIAALEMTLGMHDAGMVKTEVFSQWVIEDCFAGPRPDFARHGVQLTAHVEPWEDAKLRLLNGAHSAIAYLGGLAGFAHVHEAVAHPAIAAFVERLWDEAETTLTPPPELDLAAYRRSLKARFANAALMHRMHQIAMDGSQKLPQRLLASCRIRLENDQPIDSLALAVAAWMRWQGGMDDAGVAFAVDDPVAATARALLADLTTAQDRAAALLTLTAVFPPALAKDARFRDGVTRAYDSLMRRGALGALTDMAERPAWRGF